MKRLEVRAHMWRKAAMLVAGFLAVAGCSSGPSRVLPQGTLIYTTPRALPPAWTPTTGPPPGWSRYEGAGVELWLPSEFVGGDPVGRREELLGIARASGPGYEGVVQTLETLSEASRFYAWEFEQHETVVLVTIDEAPAAEGVEAYTSWMVDTVLSEFPGVSEVSQGTVQIAGQTVGRAVLDQAFEGGITRQVAYVFGEGASTWLLAYVFPADRYTDLLPMVEQSVQAFRVGP